MIPGTRLSPMLHNSDVEISPSAGENTTKTSQAFNPICFLFWRSWKSNRNPRFCNKCLEQTQRPPEPGESPSPWWKTHVPLPWRRVQNAELWFWSLSSACRTTRKLTKNDNKWAGLTGGSTWPHSWVLNLNPAQKQQDFSTHGFLARVCLQVLSESERQRQERSFQFWQR